MLTAVLLVGAVVGIVVVTADSNSPSFTPSNAPAAAQAPTSASVVPEPAVAPVKRHAGPLSLAQASRADLDAPASDAQWGAESTSENYDIANSGVSFYMTGAVPMGAEPATYEACRTATGYRTVVVDIEDVVPNAHFCLQTSGDRYAALTVSQVVSPKVTFDVITYDPPFGN